MTLTMGATSAEEVILSTMRIQPHTPLITSTSNKILILEAAIKLSGEWVAVNLQIIAEAKNPIPTVECTISNMIQGRITQLISSHPARAEAVAEDSPIRYIKHRNLCLQLTRVEAIQ